MSVIAMEAQPLVEELREPPPPSSETKLSEPKQRIARHSIGIFLLLVTVFLWTASNFLASTIFADSSYSKPYFVTYVNSSFFSAFLLVTLAQRIFRRRLRTALRVQPADAYSAPLDNDVAENEPFLKDTLGQPTALGTTTLGQMNIDDSQSSLVPQKPSPPPLLPSNRISERETAWLSFEFCILWFLANYFIAACLEYTTVASSTILSSTSSIWTLFIGAALHVESFSLKKLLGTVASLVGIVLTSSVDLTGSTDQNRGDFPHKSRRELATGDALALASALLYGIYTTLMKKRIGDEGRVDMALFFGLVGLFNLVLLLPGFVVLHFTGIETFELPPNRRITSIVLINSATSLVSDFCWAYSMLLTSPLVVTVGLSLTIPLSLFGQMILNHQNSSIMYWMGALVVVLSFIFINYESKSKATESPPSQLSQLDQTSEDPTVPP